MSDIALFHSVLGVRPGVLEAAERLRDAGHRVTVVDQYDGRTFDDYAEASTHAESIGYPQLMADALAAVGDLPHGFVTMGFSNGAGMATHVAAHAPVSRVVLAAGAFPLEVIGLDTWPSGVPAQVHYTADDPFRIEGAVPALLAAVNQAGQVAELVQYPGRGHLFTDPSLPEEYDADTTAEFWARVLPFVAG